MAEISYPFDGGSGASITEAQWSTMASPWQDNGVVAEGPWTTDLKVTTLAENGIVYVEIGKAVINGFMYENTAQIPVAVPANNDGSQSRIDLVILRLDKDTNTIVVAYKEGTLSSSPVEPSLSTSGQMYEIPLARIRMGPNTQAVPNTEPQLVDRRPFVGKRILTTATTSQVPRGGIAYDPTDDVFYAKTNGGVLDVSLSGHVHSEYSQNGHTHSGYAASSHTHSYTAITNTPRARVRRTGTQSIASGTGAEIVWQATDGVSGSQQGSMWSSVSNPNRLTIPSGGDGMYLVVAWLEWQGSTSGVYRTGLIRHSTGGILMEDNKTPVGSEPVRCNPVAMYYATAGSYFTIEGWQNSGGSLLVGQAWVAISRIN